MLKNKNGEEKFLSIWWFFVLAIVGVGIAAGVYIFYSSDIDIRTAEAETLSTRISDCIVKQGVITSDVLKSDFDIYEKCDLNKNLFKETFYFNVTIFGGGQEIISSDTGDIRSGTETSAIKPNFERVKNAILYAKEKKKCLCGTECGNYANLIINAAEKYKIDDPLFLLAIMMQESGCRYDAVSVSGCRGLMQICSWEMCKSELKLNSLLDLEGKNNIEKNIACGAIILKAKYNDNPKKYQCNAAGNQKEIDTIYSGWDFALRGYNGWACTGANYFYVEEVNKIYADLKGAINEEVPKERTSEEMKKIISKRVIIKNIISEESVSFQKDCEIQLSGVTAKNSAQCFEKEEKIVYGDGETGVLHILTASDNKGRRVI